MIEPIAADIAIIVIFAMTGWMLKMWLGHREKMRGLSLPKQNQASIEGRLERVEHAIESIAIEIERVSEGQRYVTKLMSDRAQSQLAAVPEATPVRRPDTPH